MTGKHIGLLVLLAVLSLGVLVAADFGLRTQTGWIGQKQRNKDFADRPFLAEPFLSARNEARFLAKELEDDADDAQSVQQRATLLFQAVDLLKHNKDTDERNRLLRRITRECSASPVSAEAYSRLIRQSVAAKPPRNPAEDVKQLIALIQTFGVGKETVSPKSIQDAIKALQKPYPDQAKTLQAALQAASKKKT